MDASLYIQWFVYFCDVSFHFTSVVTLILGLERGSTEVSLSCAVSVSSKPGALSVLENGAVQSDSPQDPFD